MAFETFILFEVAGTAYAVHSAQVQMVEFVGNITPVPNAPEFVEGVTSVRGQVLPVVAMRHRFNIADSPPPRDLRARLIVIRLDERSLAMWVDTAREFLRVSEDQIGPVPEGLREPGLEYLDGVISLPNRLILIVNLPKLFNPEERRALAGHAQPEPDRF